MIEQKRRFDRSSILVCLDSYRGGIPEGRIYTPFQEMEVFESLSQFLIKMEEILDMLQLPQSDTRRRTFPTVTQFMESRFPHLHTRMGQKATFELQVIFRQNTSWQGCITWLDRKQEQSFRSVLELILLMDSALRDVEGCEAG